MEARKNKIRYGIGIALTIILTIDLLPYLWLLVSSFRASDDPFTSSVLPSRYTIGNYVTIFQNEGLSLIHI